MLNAQTQPSLTVGVSLKMYFGHAHAVEWARAVGRIASAHPAVTAGMVELFVMPTFPSLVAVREALLGTGVRIGAQDLAWADEGPFTGEVSGRELREIGCDLAEIGHAERRALFNEDDHIVAAKVAAAVRNELTPLICVGEQAAVSGVEAAAAVRRQLDRAIEKASADGPLPAVLVAYEPVWAIGAPSPAPADHIVTVLAAIEAHLDQMPAGAGSRAIYGGSARPGLLTEAGGRIGGLFLGRFAHDPWALHTVLDESLALMRCRR
jgi:triosephosphate isomerase